MKKLYLVTRRDLPPGSQLVQSAHALREFAAKHPELDKTWYETSNTLVALSVTNEAELHELALFASDIPHAKFHEPDLGDALTAIAFGAGVSKKVSRLPKALKEYYDDFVDGLLPEAV